MAKAEAASYIVKESFVGDLGKGAMQFRQGDLIAADHPAVKKWPHLFRRDDSPIIEQATAAPGERRGGKVL